MKLALLPFLATCALGSATRSAPSPVSRVAELLQNLAQKLENEMDDEEKLYEDYVCWAKTVISSKTESNEKAQSRVDELKTYLADLAAGRIELTSERADLTKEVDTLRSDMETAEELRNKEHHEYTAAVGEMDQAITALEDAMKVLKEATEDSKAGLLSLRSRIQQGALETEEIGFSARLQEAKSLSHAIELGSRWLNKGDALFLQRLLSGEVPIRDYKKLNRKAEFKMKYKARSGKIQETLSKLLQSFKDAKSDAEKKEKEAKEEYDTLKSSKGAQLKAAEESLTKMEVENGAKAVSKSDANAEITALETQIADDKKYISETEDNLKDKKEDFVKRKELRRDEIKAISEAIAVIHSDDARDLFKKSLSFLQVRDVSASSATRAADAIRATARKSGDRRLHALAMRVSLTAGGKFDKVLTAIDDMISILEEEDKTDTSNKEECETDREKDTKEAADLSRKIDELSDDISKLKGEIEEIEKEIEEKEGNIKDLKKEMKEAKEIREKEHTEWVQSDKDDADAIVLLEKAASVLKDFYKENFSLMQRIAAMEPPVVKAGEAPPPPPKTWEGDYKGATKESNGIVSILELIKGDVEKDKETAKTEEDKAQTDHDKFIKESEDSVDKLETDISDLKSSKSDKEKDITTKEETSATKKGSLDTVTKKLKDAQPGCDFILVNFEVRADNRKLEIEGLKKAKEILEAKNK
jgi:predicted  nucleic acid-binding Zn-ribbon protein